MTKLLRRLVWALGLLVAIPFNSQATHIVGAELYYECLNPNTYSYRLTLKMYRDCLTGQAQYDNFIDVFIFNGLTGNRVQTVSIQKPASTPQIQPTTWGNCVSTVPNICVEEAIYTTVITLPPLTGGYDIGWARCCRNGTITNLALPLEAGVSFLAHIPDPGLATCNSMPQFTQRPPTFLCANQLFTFSHAAIDVDGDSLVYALSDPYTGLNNQGLGAANNQVNPANPSPIVDPFTNPMGPPPYQNVNFNAGYTFTDPFGSGNFNLDPQTGFITVTPTQTGIFVLAISVFEYRNGVLLSENKRDLQIHVINCLPPGVPPTITHDLSALNSSNDTIFVSAAQPFCYPVSVTTTNPNSAIQTYTVNAPFGNGTFAPPLATYSFSGTNPITGQICWTPSCVYNNRLIPLIIGARDPNGCQNINGVFDTVWVSITAPPNALPMLSTDLSGLQTSGDTVIVTANSNFCFPFTASDPNAGDIVTITPIGTVFTGPGAPTVTFSGQNPVNGQVCWTPGCSYAGQVVPLVLRAKDNGVCNLNGSVQKVVYVKVIPPVNTPPVITFDLSGNTTNQDTILVSALSQACFNFRITDPDPGTNLTYQGLWSIPAGPGAPVLTASGTNPVIGQVCWTPACTYAGQVIPFIIRGNDAGPCNNPVVVFDTVYIRILPPPNAPPVITVNLAGNTVSGDTIKVKALQGFCYTFEVADADPGTVITFTPNSPLFNTPNGPTLTFGGTNPVTGQVCWTPGCDRVGQVIPLTFSASDNGSCDGQLSVQKTIYIDVTTPPNLPPVITRNLGNLTFNGDTVYVDALQNVCYSLVLSDPNAIDTLTPILGPIFQATNPATVTFTGINPVSGQVCFVPDCSQEGAIIEIIVGVVDNAACDNNFTTYDTLYIKVNDPLTIAPIIGQDISGLPNIQGDSIFIEINDDFCYDFFVKDLTPSTGVVYTYEVQTLGGLNIGGAIVSTVQRNDSLIGRVCFESDCSNGGSYYRLILSARDEAVCPPYDAASDTVYLKVNTDFLSYAGRDTFFCEGTGGVQLQVTPIGGTAPYYYSWWCSDTTNGGCGLSSTYISNPVVNPTDTNYYFVQVTDANGCTSEWGNLRVVPSKLPRVDAGPDQYICSGGAGVKLKCIILNPLEAPGPYTYTWTPALGLNDPHSPTPIANPDTTTIYRVVVTDNLGCSSDFTSIDPLSTLTVFVKESPEVEAGKDQDICLGDTTQMQGFAIKAGPNYTFRWTPAHGLVDSTKATTKASPPFTTTYSLVAWSNGCPSRADQVTIQVHTIPTISLSGAFETCYGDSVRLTAIAGGDSTATYNYLWSPSRGLSDSNAAQPMASPDLSTLYGLNVVSNFGCKSEKAFVPVVVRPTPIADAGRDTAICRGDTVLLFGNHVVRGGVATEPIFYRWTPFDGLSNPFIPTPSASPSQTTNYRLEISSGACSSFDNALITVAEPVSASIVADTNRICAGDSVRLQALGGLGSASYQWSPAASVDNPRAGVVYASPGTTTTFIVTVSENICSDTASLRIAVNPTPVADYQASALAGCAPFTVFFQENVATQASWIWDFGDGSALSNEGSPAHTFDLPGSYPVRLIATGPGGCETRYEQTVVVTPFGQAAFRTDPAIGVPVVLPNARVLFIDESQGAIRYFWDFGDENSSTEPNPTHVYQAAGEYTVKLVITDEGGCIDTAIHFPVVIINPDLFIPNVFSPNDDGINDGFTVKYTGKETFAMKVFDRWGRLMYEGISVAQNSWNGLTSNGAAAPNGVYYYVVMIGDKPLTGNVTLVR